MAGPRLGRFNAEGKPRTIPGHNAVFYVTGVILLWCAQPDPTACCCLHASMHFL